MKAFGCLGLLIYIVVLSLLSGFVLVQLWDWFVVPNFDVPSITIQTALGIGLIVGMYTHKAEYPDKEKHTTEESIYMMIGSVSYPVLALVIGYIIHIL